MRQSSSTQAPPFCPNPKCRFHRRDRHLWTFRPIGFYTRQSAPHRVQRWRCDTCRRCFGAQTFRLTYRLRRPQLLQPLVWRLIACSAFRQIAREVKCSPSTVAGLSDRLGRHALLFHEAVRPKGALTEPLAADGFESFELSQYYPTSWHVAAGRESHYFYGFTDSECRRRGSMTPAQKRRRFELEARLGRPDPRSIEREMAALLGIVAGASRSFELWTDQHGAYPRALRRLAQRVCHRVVSSRAARTSRNPLFAVNLLDLLLRHWLACHKRETIAFGKRRASIAYRVALFLVMRNYVLPFSVRKKGPTPAMRLGLLGEALKVEEIFDARLFITRSTLPKRWRDYYWKRLKTRALGCNRAFVRRYAA